MILLRVPVARAGKPGPPRSIQALSSMLAQSSDTQAASKEALMKEPAITNKFEEWQRKKKETDVTTIRAGQWTPLAKQSDGFGSNFACPYRSQVDHGRK